MNPQLTHVSVQLLDALICLTRRRHVWWRHPLLTLKLLNLRWYLLLPLCNLSLGLKVNSTLSKPFVKLVNFAYSQFRKWSLYLYHQLLRSCWKTKCTKTYMISAFDSFYFLNDWCVDLALALRHAAFLFPPARNQYSKNIQVITGVARIFGVGQRGIFGFPGGLDTHFCAFIWSK